MQRHSAADRCELTEQQVCFGLKEMTTRFLRSRHLDFQAFTLSDFLFTQSDLTCSLSLSVFFLILTSHLVCFTRKSCLMSGSALYPWACGHVSLVLGILLLVSSPLLTAGTTSDPHLSTLSLHAASFAYFSRWVLEFSNELLQQVEQAVNN